MRPTTRLEANVIFVSDVARAEEWYARMLGMVTVELRPPEFLHMRLGGHSFFIETPSPRRAAGFEGGPVGGRSSVVFGVADVGAFCTFAAAAGAVIRVAPVRQHWGGVNAVIADPDGNEFVLDQVADGPEDL